MTGGFFALLVGAACWAPLAPTALAPSPPIDETVANGPVAAAAVVPPAVLAAVPKATVAVPAPTPSPTALPTPVVVPTLTANGLNALAAIKADRTAQWVRNTAETPLLSGPTDAGVVFTRLPQWTLLKQIGSQPGWLMVQYSGDGETREAGPGWVKASDVGAVDPPTVWLSTARAGTVWSTSDATASRVVDVPQATLMEVTSTDFIQGTRVHVRLPGNGRTVPPAEGWVDGDTIARAATPSTRDLPRAYPQDLRADIRLSVPYRTQLDGSDYAGANCGPTVLGMGLEAFGVDMSPPDLRGQVLNSENFDPSDTDAGSYIWALADVAREEGLQAHGLYDADGSMHHWSVDEIRTSVRNRQPVIVQVVYRGLPGREDSGYYGDHYIIITGLLGDQFLYNDPIGGAEARESPGYDRIMNADELQHAMRASDAPFAYTAFSLSR